MDYQNIFVLMEGETRILEDPFEWNVYFRTSEDSDWILWRMPKQEVKDLATLPKKLYVEGRHILLLQ